MVFGFRHGLGGLPCRHSCRHAAAILNLMSKMLEEIRQQPEALERTLQAELRRIEAFQTLVAARRPRLVVLAARGTSDNAALFGRYLLEITTGIPVSLAAPSVYTLYDAALDLRDTLVIGISQSGESTDTNLVLERARARGALTVGITNERGSTLARLAEWPFLVRAGREKSIAATKTYTGQLLMFYLLAWALGGAIRLDDLRRVSGWAAAALRLEDDIRERCQRYRFMTDAVVVGRGLNYATAFEFSLKLMETCRIIAERFSAADFLHGPIAMVERSLPVFLFAPAGPTWTSMSQTLDRVATLKAELLIVTDRANAQAAQAASRPAVVIPARLEELYTPIPYIIPAQVFAAALAEEKGLDPDRPGGLTKVTRTL